MSITTNTGHIYGRKNWMNKEEAFRQWIADTQGNGFTFKSMWDAACEWQKEQDAVICELLDLAPPSGYDYYNGQVDCADAIRTQA